MTYRKQLWLAVLLIAVGVFFVAGQVTANCGNCKHGDQKAACDKKCDDKCKQECKAECKAECKEKCKADCKGDCKGDCKCDCKGDCKHADKKDCSAKCQGGHASQGNSADCPMHAQVKPADTTAAKK